MSTQPPPTDPTAAPAVYEPPPGFPAVPATSSAPAGQPSFPPPGYPASGAPTQPYGTAPSAQPYAPASSAQPYAPAFGAPGQQYAPGHPVPSGAPIQQFPGQPGGQLAVTSCRMCGNIPAVDTTFRGHRGLIVLMQFLSTEGPFCRNCGLGTFRHMTSRTLVQGWYGYGSAIITPITVLINLFRRNKVAKLAPPQPNPYGPSRPPMDPGPRLLQRPMTWIGLLIPFAIIVLIILAASSN
jgi:hypothetical protein